MDLNYRYSESTEKQESIELKEPVESLLKEQDYDTNRNRIAEK